MHSCALVTLLLISQSSAVFDLASGTCEHDIDCQLNGVCDADRGSVGRCHCDPAWGGDDCGDLQLEVGKVVYGCYPTDPLQCNYSAWGGGPPVFDHKKNVWVMFQDRIANHCGLSEWSYMSTIVRNVKPVLL